MTALIPLFSGLLLFGGASGLRGGLGVALGCRRWAKIGVTLAPFWLAWLGSCGICDVWILGTVAPTHASEREPTAGPRAHRPLLSWPNPDWGCSGRDDLAGPPSAVLFVV